MHRKAMFIEEINYNRNRRESGAEDLEDFADLFEAPMIYAGDFNLPVDSNIFRHTLYDFTDAFSATGFGFGMTYHAKWTITRIDHIVGNEGWRFGKCYVGPFVGSPHRPVIADMEWVGKTSK